MTKHLDTSFQEAAKSVGATVREFRTIRAMLAAEIKSATNQDLTDRIGPEIVKAYYICDADTREALIAQTIRNILQIAGTSNVDPDSIPAITAGTAETWPPADSSAEKPLETVGVDG